MKRLLFLVTIFVFFTNLYGEKLDRKTIQSAEFLSEVASSLNKQLPMMIDKETRLDSVYGTKKNLVFKYTLVNISYGDYTKKQIKDALYDNIKNSVCTNPKTVIFPKNGININYDYYSKRGKFMAEITISPKDCGYRE